MGYILLVSADEAAKQTTDVQMGAKRHILLEVVCTEGTGWTCKQKADLMLYARQAR